MPTRGLASHDGPSKDFDWSTPEASLAMEGLSDLILEIRNEVARVGSIEHADLLQQQNQRIRLLLERVMGRRLAGGAIRVLKPVAWTIRPIRVALARRRGNAAVAEDG